MNAETMRDGQARVLRIDGEMTIYRALEVKELLLAALDGAGSLALDLSGVTELDTAGVQLLLAAEKSVALHIAERSPAVSEALDVLGLGGRFFAPHGKA